MSNIAKHIETLFAAAAEMSGEARQAFLDRECVGQDTLRRQLDGLLQAHDRVNHQLDQPLAGFQGLEETWHLDKHIAGTLIAGRYKLLEQIGDGGMGTVWMAEQKAPVKRLVAVKLIKAGMDSKAVLARFEAERQALALMDHPNIAKVHDAGTDDQGRPYFAMELVKGLPLTEYCDARKLSVNERLDLFVQICSAVQHAHQKAIIHRDLKPANVLVTEHDGKPVPKVIDFGLAKALNSSQMLTERTLHTAYGTVVGTPLYMAPEQVGINALDVDTRTDIYALGVILYELLTGTTPLEKAAFKEAAWEEIKRLIRDVEPPRPSTRLSSDKTLQSLAASRQVDAAKLPGLIRGELDWIVMKALDKDRTRRYETASGFAKDVQRYLQGDAVEACPPTFRYRLTKAYRQHRAAVLVGSAFAAVLLLATSVSIIFGLHASRAKIVAQAAEQDVVVQRDEALQQRKLAELERDNARAARAELRRSHYLAAMSLIPAAWKTDNLGRILELLDEQRPQPGDQEDIRGFEWHYWDRLCRGHVREMSLGEDVFHSAISGDGSRAAVVRKAKDSVPEQVEGRGSPLESYRIEIIDLATGRVVRELATLKMRYFKLRLNQDGSRLAMDMSDGDSRLIAWDIPTGRKLIDTDGKKNDASQIAMSPSGRYVAIVQFQGTKGAFFFPAPDDEAKLTILDLEHPTDTPKTCSIQLQSPYSRNVRSLVIYDLCFNTAEDQLAFLIDPIVGPRFFAIEAEQLGCSVHLVDIGTMQTHKVADLETRQLSIAFTPDGQHLTGITAGPERLLRWDITNPDQCKEVLAKQLAVSSQRVHSTAYNPRFEIQHSPDGNNVLLTASRPTTWIIDAQTGELNRTLKSPGDIRDIAFSNGGGALRAILRRDSIQHTEYVVQEWEFAAQPAANGQNDNPRIRTTLSSDGERQAVYLPDEDRVSIRKRGGEELHSFAVPELRHYQPRSTALDHVPTKTSWSLPGVQLTFSRNGRYLCVRENRSLNGFTGRILETDTGKICWSPDDQNSDSDPKTRLLNRTTTILSPDQRYLALFGAGKVEVVSLDNPQDRFEIKTQAWSDGEFSTDGKRLLVEDRETISVGGKSDVGRMQLWDMDTKRLIRSENYGPPSSAFSADSQYYAAVAFGEKTLHFGNAVNGEELWTAQLMDSNGDQLAIHPHGKLLVTFNFSSLLLSQGRRSAPTIWDTKTGEVLGFLEGITGSLDDVVFSPDGNRIATLSDTSDGQIEVRLWDAATFRELLTLTHWKIEGGNLSFSSDGNHLTYDTDMIPEDPMYGAITWDAKPLDAVKQ
jgi:WD40 repeat protein